MNPHNEITVPAQEFVLIITIKGSVGVDIYSEVINGLRERVLCNEQPGNKATDLAAAMMYFSRNYLRKWIVPFVYYIAADVNTVKKSCF